MAIEKYPYAPPEADDENPYAAPEAEVLNKFQHLDAATEAYRDGKLLVVRKDAELTDRCLKCAAPVEGYRFTRTVYWHKPIWFFLILFNWLIYLLVYFMVRWKARVTVALCPRHRKNRRWAIGMGWMAALAGIGVIIATASYTRPERDTGTLVAIGFISGLVLVFGGIIGGVIGSQVIVPKRINEQFVWLGRVSPAYLAKLPDWNL